MSNDKKRDRALQRRVRERQAKTGESYQAAWQQLADQGKPEPGPEFHNSTGLPLLNIVVGAPNYTRRVPLSLSAGADVKVLPGQSAQITARPQLESFWPDRILIKNADRWVIHRLSVGCYGKNSETALIETDYRASMFSLDTWHPLTTREVPCGEDIVIVVTYDGPNEQGEAFEATLFGWEGRPPMKDADRHEADSSERIAVRAESKNVVPCESAELPLTVASPVLYVDRLTIADAKYWIVNDIIVRGKSIFVQAGDLPGQMFSDHAQVVLEPLAAKDRVEIVATYVGLEKSSRLVVELSGTEKPSKHPVSYFLPMSTGVPVLSCQSAQITARPQRKFLPERLVIADSDNWIVNDIKAGVRSQLASSGDLPGQTFSSRVVGGHVTLDPVHAGQDFIMVVTRGEDSWKSPFFCGVQGRLIEAR